MPIYEYKCSKCGHEFEVLQRHYDVDEAPCEACGAPGKRMMSNTSFVLKGTGWYVTDYKSNGGCSAAGGNGCASKATSDADAAPAASGSSSCAASSGGCSCASAPAASASGSTTSAS